MKFGQNLYRCQVSEWTPFYIDYNSLKKIYKIASKAAREQERDADFTGLSLNHVLFPSVLISL